MQSPTVPGREPVTTRVDDGGPGDVGLAALPGHRGVGRAGPPLPARCAARWSAEDTDALVLMLSELATNAVHHAATEYEVSVSVAPDGRQVRVEVSDAAGGYPVPQEPAADAPHGRGLHIVRDAGRRVGHRDAARPPGKTVWFSSALAAPGRVPGRGARCRPRRRSARRGEGDGQRGDALREALVPGRPAARHSSRPGRCPPCGRCSTA